MKKITAIGLVVLLAVSSMFAQGATEKADDGVIELKVLNYMDMSEPNSINDEKMIWDRFEEENPGIKVIREDLFNEPFHQKTEAYVASGNLPDVIYMWPSGRSTSLHATGSVKDLTPFLERDGLMDTYSPAVLAPQAGGYIGELANGITATHMLYVNKAVLEENGFDIPTSYEEIKEMAGPLKAKGIETIAMDNQDSWVMQSCLFSMVVGRYGGADWFERLEAGKIDFEDEWFVKSLELIDDMYTSGVINRNTLSSPYGSNRANIVTGKAAFLIDGDWSTGAFTTDVTTGESLIPKDRQESDYELIIMPELPGEVLHNSNSGIVGTGFGMSANIEDGSAREEAAWKLIKFLQSEYVQTYRLSVGASFPSNLNVDAAKVVAENDLDPLLAKRAAYYTIPEVLTPVVDGVLDPEVYNVINVGLQEIGLGEKTPMQVARETQKAWKTWNADK